MTEHTTILSLAAMLSVAAASGFVGVFALMRRMTLAADAISHIALPGLGIAILLKINPLIGGAAALLIGAVLVWALERRTKIATETIIGVVFSASLALGSLLTPEQELLEALFGDLGALSTGEALVGIGAAAAIIFFILLFKEKLTLSFISPDLAKTTGLNIDRLNLVFMFVFVATVLMGLQFLGVLLMGSLIIVPAAAARNLARSLNANFLFSCGTALFSVFAGVFFASRFGVSIGPMIISIAAGIFFVSLLSRR